MSPSHVPWPRQPLRGASSPTELGVRGFLPQFLHHITERSRCILQDSVDSSAVALCHRQGKLDDFLQSEQVHEAPTMHAGKWWVSPRAPQVCKSHRLCLFLAGAQGRACLMLPGMHELVNEHSQESSGCGKGEKRRQQSRSSRRYGNCVGRLKGGRRRHDVVREDEFKYC